MDCLDPSARIRLTTEPMEGDQTFQVTAESLASWLERWLGGTNMYKDMYVVRGYRDGTNPFTGERLDQAAPVWTDASRLRSVCPRCLRIKTSTMSRLHRGPGLTGRERKHR
jgi:hypothetical protein